MYLVPNVKNAPILTKSPTYSLCFFLKMGPFLIQQKISKLNTQFERPYKELSNALLSFEICHY